MKNVKAVANELLYSSRDWWRRVAEGVGGELGYFKHDYMNRRIVITKSDYGYITLTQEWGRGIPFNNPVTIVRLGEEESFKRQIPIDNKYIDRLKLFIKSYKGL